jgi:hypothetical protein
LNKSRLKVEATSPDPSKSTDKALGFIKTSFQEGLLEFFTGIEGKTALSYSVASVDNIESPDHIDLNPAKFQFATFSKGHLGIISIFININGGFADGETVGLQSLWQAQWLHNNTEPIPERFTTGLILSSEMLHHVLLKPGFAKSNWDVSNATRSKHVVARLGIFRSSSITVINWSSMSTVLTKKKDYPMSMTITQNNPTGSPDITARLLFTRISGFVIPTIMTNTARWIPKSRSMTRHLALIYS